MILEKLIQEHYRTITAGDGALGLLMAKEHSPSLIITDWMMPNMDGPELITHLRQTTSTSHIPVIMLTAKSQTDDKVISLGLGADDYITKPFNPTELLARVANLIRTRQQLQVLYASNPLSAEISPIEARELRFLTLVEHMVKEKMTDEHFDIAQLAEALKLSRSQLYRKIKALTNATPQEYVLDIRLKAGLSILQKENPPTVSEVSFQVGIANPSYFSKAFKKKFGVSPSEYGA
jgi:DNA-binding response OmpR family regulator